MCVLGVKSANRDEKLSRLARTGVEKFMVVPNSSYTKDGYHCLLFTTAPPVLTLNPNLGFGILHASMD